MPEKLMVSTEKKKVTVFEEETKNIKTRISMKSTHGKEKERKS